MNVPETCPHHTANQRGVEMAGQQAYSSEDGKMRTKPTSIASVLPLNMAGQDWFVGDIHGHYERLGQALDRAGFRRDCDRLICVGDLVDRGPASKDSLAWLAEPWFFSVRGNHDDMFLAWRKLRKDPQKQLEYGEDKWFPNGGRWILKTPEPIQARMETALSSLPYVLVVPHADGRLVAAVHSNLPSSARWPDLIDQPEAIMAKAAWNRQRTEQGGAPVEGLDAVVCGHTPMRKPTWIGHFFHIDTGGWREDGTFTLVTLDKILGDTRNA